MKSNDKFPREAGNKPTDECLKEWKTLVQLKPANGKQSGNKGHTSSATVMSRSGELSERLLASTDRQTAVN